MNTRQKKALYESIMKSVAKTVKNNLNEMAKHTDKNFNNSITLPKELKDIIISTQKHIIENCIDDSGPLKWYYDDLIYDDGLPYLGEDYISDYGLYDYFMDHNNGEFDNCEDFIDVWDLLDDNMKQQISKVANKFTLKYFKGNTNVNYKYYI